jgi:hypothetical protein
MPTYVRDGGVWKEVSGSSFTGNADTADQVSTGTTTGTGTYYPTFVDSNNSTRQNEFLYTDAGITYNPSTNSLGIGTTNPQLTLDVFGNVRIGNDDISGSGRIFRGIANSFIVLNGGAPGTQGANIELYGPTHSTKSNNSFFDGQKHTFRDLNTGVDQVTFLSISADGSVFNNVVQISSGIKDYYGSVGAAGSILTVVGAGLGVSWTNPSNITAASGRLLRAPQIRTSGTTYTTPANCTSIYVEAVGGGGGGGRGAFSDGGGGGGAGGYCAKYFTVVAGTSYTYAIGAGGIANSGNGGNTTFTVGGTTITAGGGGGGIEGNSEDTYNPGGGLGGSSTNGDLNVRGGGGGAGSLITTSGAGGSSFFGGGGRGVYDSAANAGERGGGGGGGSDNRNGGAGGAGLIRIWEFS